MSTSKFAKVHNMVAFLSKPTESEGFEQIINFLNAHSIKYTLTVNPTIYTSCIEQFWATAKMKNINREAQLHAQVDGKKVVISKAFIMRDLQFGDEGGVDYLPNEEIFEQLTLIATNQKFNFSKYIFDSIVKHLDSGNKFLMYPRHRRCCEKEVVKVVTTAKMIIDAVVDATQVTTSIVNIPVSAAKIIVTNALTITGESTKTNVEKKDQILFDEEVARKLQEEINEEERLVGERELEKRTELVMDGSNKDEVADNSLKRIREELEQENAKKQKMEDDKEYAELKQCLEIIPDDGDNVTIDATPLSSKSPTIVDFKIYKEGKKNYF
nr:hypothetical protein [Tanacetum cinerariifolium]